MPPPTPGIPPHFGDLDMAGRQRSGVLKGVSGDRGSLVVKFGTTSPRKSVPTKRWTALIEAARGRLGRLQKCWRVGHPLQAMAVGPANSCPRVGGGGARWRDWGHMQRGGQSWR